MKDILSHFKINTEPKEFSGLKKYYKQHQQLPWGAMESSNYNIGVSPIDVHSGCLSAPEKPHLFVVDELKIGDQVFHNLTVVDAHGHVRDGDWTVKNDEGDVDVSELVKELITNKRRVDLLLACSQYAHLSCENVSDPPPAYYQILNENSVVYSRSGEIIVPILRMSRDGKISGYITDAKSFENFDKLKK